MSTAVSETLQDVIACLGPVSIAELDAAAALRTRIDRKYLLDMTTAALALAGRNLRALEIDGDRSFEYRSLYLDTPDLLAYRGAVQRRRRRLKVRVRQYVGSGTSMLEVKTKSGQGHTVKSRHDLPHGFDAVRCRFDHAAQHFLDETTGVAGLAERLRPTMWTAYRRSTLVDVGNGERFTIDSDLVAGLPEGPLRPLTGRVIVETKAAGGATEIDRALWRLGERPQAFSKYIAAMAMHDPTLPANKWNRVLRRHLGWQPSP